MGHCCLDLNKYQIKIIPNLRETPFLNEFRLFVDGSSRLFKEKDITDILW
jgi:hypothetical protein